MSRVKKLAVQAPAWEAVEQIVGSLGREQISLAELMASMDREIDRVRERYAEKLGNVEAAIVLRLALLEAAAQANPEKFKDKKSVEFLSGTIGFRTGMPCLKTLAKWTWDKVLKRLVAEKREEFVQEVQPRVNKEAILTARDALGEKGLAALGVKVHQDETFYAEPKLSRKDAVAA
jgi:phage host-nuclease inhibitor protein Gam